MRYWYDVKEQVSDYFVPCFRLKLWQKVTRTYHMYIPAHTRGMLLLRSTYCFLTQIVLLWSLNIGVRINQYKFWVWFSWFDPPFPPPSMQRGRKPKIWAHKYYTNRKNEIQDTASIGELTCIVRMPRWVHCALLGGHRKSDDPREAPTSAGTATHCKTLHHTAPHCTTGHHSAPHYNTLQNTATHFTNCNTLQ